MDAYYSACVHMNESWRELIRGVEAGDGGGSDASSTAEPLLPPLSRPRPARWWRPQLQRGGAPDLRAGLHQEQRDVLMAVEEGRAKESKEMSESFAPKAETWASVASNPLAAHRRWQLASFRSARGGRRGVCVVGVWEGGGSGWIRGADA